MSPPAADGWPRGRSPRSTRLSARILRRRRGCATSDRCKPVHCGPETRALLLGRAQIMTRAAGHTLVARERRFGLDAAPYRDGHPERDARLVLRCRRPPRSRGARRARAAAPGGGRRPAGRRAASPASPTGPPSIRPRRSSGSCPWWSGWPRTGAALSVDTYKPRGGAGRRRGGGGDGERPERPDRSRRGRRVRRLGRGAGRDPHPRAPQGEAPPPALRRRRRRREALPRRASRGRAGGGRAGRPAARVPRARTSARTRRRRSSCCARLDEIEALGLPVLLAVSRKDFVGALTRRAPARAARRHAWPRSRTASTTGRTSCACTTSPPRATSSQCGRRCAVTCPCRPTCCSPTTCAREEVEEEGRTRRRRAAA